MIPLFNVEIGTRLADLQAAISRGSDIGVSHEPPWGRQTDRLSITIGETGRVLVFPVPVAKQVAAQLRANGVEDLAQRIEAEIAKVPSEEQPEPAPQTESPPVSATKAKPRPKRKPAARTPPAPKPSQRIMSLETFMSTPRTPQEVTSYHDCLAALQRMGMVDENLNIIESPKAA